MGKTAIAEGLARRIVSGDVPETLKNKRLVAMDLSAMIAGAKYRGEFEDRLKAFLKEIVASEGISPDTFDFEMLFGVRRDLQLRLVDEGYRVRVYLPYGQQWYPYLVRRLAERPANIAFFVRSLVSEALAGRRNGHP